MHITQHQLLTVLLLGVQLGQMQILLGGLAATAVLEHSLFLLRPESVELRELLLKLMEQLLRSKVEMVKI